MLPVRKKPSDPLVLAAALRPGAEPVIPSLQHPSRRTDTDTYRETPSLFAIIVGYDVATKPQ
jgi:hypothetical protein